MYMDCPKWLYGVLLISMHRLLLACQMQAQSANMDGGMLDLYPTPADLRKQQVADIQAKRQEKVLPPRFCCYGCVQHVCWL